MTRKRVPVLVTFFVLVATSAGVIAVTSESRQNESACSCSAVTLQSGAEALACEGQADPALNVDANVEVNVDVDDVSSSADEAVGPSVNVGSDSRSGLDCPERDFCACSVSDTDISAPPRRSTTGLETGVDAMRAIVRSGDFAGLAMPGRVTDCEDARSEPTTDCPAGREAVTR